MLHIMSMALRQIRLYPDPVLRNRTSRVEHFDSSLDRLIEDMVETMHAAPGVGLAANQVGVPLQLAVIDLSAREDEGQRHPLIVIINPEVLFMEGSVIAEGGCLSIPDYAENVKRATRVKVRALDRSGKPIEIEAEGLLAKALQHEIDHLNGVLFVDKLSPLKKSLFKRRFRKALAEKA
jgi:peptide deformylase